MIRLFYQSLGPMFPIILSFLILNLASSLAVVRLISSNKGDTMFSTRVSYMTCHLAWLISSS